MINQNEVRVAILVRECVVVPEWIREHKFNQTLLALFVLAIEDDRSAPALVQQGRDWISEVDEGEAQQAWVSINDDIIRAVQEGVAARVSALRAGFLEARAHLPEQR
jgi:hypothetical protein